ncbi:hypothetical protein Dimus_037126 [Dionaea muscipula]
MMDKTVLGNLYQQRFSKENHPSPFLVNRSVRFLCPQNLQKKKQMIEKELVLCPAGFLPIEQGRVRVLDLVKKRRLCSAQCSLKTLKTVIINSKLKITNLLNSKQLGFVCGREGGKCMRGLRRRWSGAVSVRASTENWARLLPPEEGRG